MIDRVLITGGAGSLGTALTLELLERGAKRVVVYSRDEYKHAVLNDKAKGHPNLRCFIGDVCDSQRLRHAMYEVDTVIHCAALKRVDAIAYNPLPAVQTNVLGSAQVIDAALERGVGRVLMISSDKAVAPENFYGLTKALMEGYAIASNAIAYPRGTKISVVRYGNVCGSRGSVITIWRQQRDTGVPLTVTDLSMTRFWITMRQAVNFILTSLDMMWGGEVFVPMLPATVLRDLAAAIAPDWPIVTTGLRHGGEKYHEQLMLEGEQERAIDAGDRYIIPPALHPWIATHQWEGGHKAHLSGPYTSDRAPRLSVEDLRVMLEEV